MEPPFLVPRSPADNFRTLEPALRLRLRRWVTCLLYPGWPGRAGTGSGACFPDPLLLSFGSADLLVRWTTPTILQSGALGVFG